VSIESDLKREIKSNDYTLDIIEADELIAVWRYRRCNRFAHSVDLNKGSTAVALFGATGRL
jgi:hypothetical protein